MIERTEEEKEQLLLKREMEKKKQMEEYLANLRKIADNQGHIVLDDNEVWLRMWCAVVNNVNCEGADSATRVADEGLTDYHKRFGGKP